MRTLHSFSTLALTKESDPSFSPGLPLVPLAPFSPPSRHLTPLVLYAFHLPREQCGRATILMLHRASAALPISVTIGFAPK